MEFKIPKPLKLEHKELHEELVRATKSGGKTAEAAKAVAGLLHPHFVKEEEYALPPLGILSAVAHGKIKPGMEQVVAMTEKLKAELPQMLEEHKAVVAALKKLIAAAKKEKKPQFAKFAEKLMLHAKAEEEFFYPASILVGELLRLKSRTEKVN